MAPSSQIDRLRAGGILNPEIVIEEAKREGLQLSLACALLQPRDLLADHGLGDAQAIGGRGE